MRIAGTIEHPQVKITIFQLENKFLVKFETGMYEQTYKFRTGGAIERVGDVQQLVDEEFIQGVLQVFPEMNRRSQAALSRLQAPPEEDEFDDII